MAQVSIIENIVLNWANDCFGYAITLFSYAQFRIVSQTMDDDVLFFQNEHWK